MQVTGAWNRWVFSGEGMSLPVRVEKRDTQLPSWPEGPTKGEQCAVCFGLAEGTRRLGSDGGGEGWFTDEGKKS
jgi:hypothetical protein